MDQERPKRRKISSRHEGKVYHPLLEIWPYRRDRKRSGALHLRQNLGSTASLDVDGDALGIGEDVFLDAEGHMVEGVVF